MDKDYPIVGMMYIDENKESKPIVKVIDVHEVKNTYYFLMKNIENGDTYRIKSFQGLSPYDNTRETNVKVSYYKMFSWYAVETFEKTVNDWIRENKDMYNIINQISQLDHKGKLTIVIEYQEK